MLKIYFVGSKIPFFSKLIFLFKKIKNLVENSNIHLQIGMY